MRTESTAPIVRTPAVSTDGVLFLYSPNLGIRVRYGSLAIDLGRGRSLTVDRASEPRLRRLVICGRGGWWTFEVPVWLRGIGASWLHLDLTGRILGSGPGEVSPDLPALRRAQALAAGSEAGVQIGRDLLSLKIDGQAAALSGVSGTDEAQSSMRDHATSLTTCSSASELRAVEAQAALLFWQALTTLPLRFLASDEVKVPASWRTVGRRSSILTGSPRGASTPAHALWNFAYSCAVGEVGVALRSVGLDPGISPTGLHTDTPSRASATYDALEAIRGEVDRLILPMIGGRRFRRRDFVHQPDGRVRLTAPLARELAEAVLPVARQAVAPIAEGLARTLAHSAGGARSQVPRLPTNLSGDTRSRGRDGVRNGPRKAPNTSARIRRALLPPACRQCGIMFEDGADRGRRLCDECLPLVRAEQVEAFAKAGPIALARMRESGENPQARPKTKRKIGRANALHVKAAKEWDGSHEPRDPAVFAQEILPGLQGVPVGRLAEATGLSALYCSQIRRGLRVPHPRHWEALRRAGALDRSVRGEHRS